MIELTAEQKIRQTLTGSPVGDLHFQHEGDQVVRWLTGGTLPDAYVTFHQEGEQIAAKCATCKTVIGYLPADHDREQTAKAIMEIRQAGHEHSNNLP